MEDYKKEIYANLGLLSVRFANMEYNLSEILIKFINSDEDLITLCLIERNGIDKNIQLLEKIIEIRNFYPEHLKELISKIRGVKSDRNLLIHGLWKEPYESQNDIEVICEDRKIKFPSKKPEHNQRKKWRLNSFKKYRLSYLKKLIIEIDDIILAQKHIIKLQDENE